MRWRHRPHQRRLTMAKKITDPTYLAAMEAATADPARARFWAGLDVGVHSTSVCVVDSDGKVVHQAAMKSDPTEIGRYLYKNFTSNIVHIGLESGSTSGHLALHLRRQGFQVAVLDALQ